MNDQGALRTLRIRDYDLEDQVPSILPSHNRPEQERSSPRRPIDIFRGGTRDRRLPPPLYTLNAGPGEENLSNTGLPSYESVIPPPPAYIAARTTRRLAQLTPVQTI